MSLGTCDRPVGHHGEVRCGGPLCVSGRMVECERCGHQRPDHPILKLADATRPAPEAVVGPTDLGYSLPERLLALERKVPALERELDAVRAELAELRPGQRKRGA